MNCECDICSNNIPFEMPKEIIEALELGNLVLFCGAGISTECKTVLPYTLYSTIQEELHINDHSLSFSELMQKYCTEPNGRRKLVQAIRNRFEYIHSFPELKNRATEFHEELSELYSIKTIITTNWDTFFEDCCGAIPITIPEDLVFWNDNDRYVIKIHGSINILSSLILTSDDYSECYKKLQNGAIGARLKAILTTKTVVFIGFSFGDEDLTKILQFLREEMHDFFPHIYIVTIDNTLKSKLKYSNLTCLVTGGTFFLHQLKLTLKKKQLIKNCNTRPMIEYIASAESELHSKISLIKIKKFPCVIFTLAYQDGVLHAFERFIQMYNRGEYNIPGRVNTLVNKYSIWIENYHKNGNYWDESYYKGYLNGLVLIDSCEGNPDILKGFSFIYLPNAKCELNSYEVYIEELQRVSKKRDKYVKYAKKIVEKYSSSDIVVHHPPY